jgi:hypothetical protein
MCACFDIWKLFRPNWAEHSPPNYYSSRFVFLFEAYEHPVVPPQVSHFRQVPLRTSVKLPHSPQASPS